MMGRNWTNISIPTEMKEEIEELIEKEEVKKKFGFGSVSEFVRNAISDKIREFHDMLEKSK